ncbi:hypothetical protein [Luethyella okanaganae]|uniref:Uncharacterized protein n=1 Tax=Luethyella okanaganae TaxID=69372 RepID=A0ABW1VCR0_9MICO
MYIVAGVAALILASGAVPARAAELTGDPLATIAAFADSTTAAGTESETGVTVEVPNDPSAGIMVEGSDSGEPVTIGDGADTAVIEAPGVTPYSLRIPIDVPDGASLVAAEGGGAQILATDGLPIGVFAMPWALDANDQPVGKRYEIEGETVVQIVEHGEGSAYPVVADPTYVTTTYWLSRADVERMWNVLQTTGAVCNYLPLPYVWSISCAAGSALVDAVSSAHYQQKRIKAVYYNCGFTYCNYYRYYVVS